MSHPSAAEMPESQLGEKEFARIADMLRADAGIHLVAGKAPLVHGRLIKRLRALGISRFSDYCDLIAGPAGVAERCEMMAALTTNVTSFFREPHHFSDLRARVLPPLLDEARRGGRVRIWSAASSSGQEPYSIALTVLDMLPQAASLDVRVLATDIDPNMVRATAAGVYDESALSAVPQAMRRRWFERCAKAGVSGEPQLRANEELRQLVAPRELNLVGKWPMAARYHAVFCRNVVIYFEAETQAMIWSRIAPYVVAGGTLYIGHSERVSGAAAQRFTPDGVTTYRRHEEAAA